MIGDEHRLLLRITAEIALVATTFLAGTMWWQLRKRKALVKKIVTEEVFLEELVSKDAVASSPSKTPEKAHLLHPIQLFEVELRNDQSSQRIPKVSTTVVLLVVLFASYLVASWCVWINFGIFLLVGLVPTTDSARHSASEHVLALARILQKWRLANLSECDAFVTPRASLHKLYNAVKTPDQV